MENNHDPLTRVAPQQVKIHVDIFVPWTFHAPLIKPLTECVNILIGPQELIWSNVFKEPSVAPSPMSVTLFDMLMVY